MPRNEDGELELVLGNTQLLSFFFVVVGLLGVFFAMGYLVGRTSAPALADGKTVARVESRPITVQTTEPKPFETPAPITPKAEVPKQEPKAKETAKPQPIATAPQQNVETPPKADPLPKETTTKKERPSEPKQARTKAEAKNAGVGEAASGKTYLQLSATRRVEAETYVDVLRKKGFTAIAARVQDKGDLYRVLVGPVGDGQINKLRADLQKGGFPGDKALRKKF